MRRHFRTPTDLIRKKERRLHYFICFQPLFAQKRLNFLFWSSHASVGCLSVILFILRNKVGFCSMQGKFLGEEVAKRSLSASWLIQIREMPSFVPKAVFYKKAGFSRFKPIPRKAIFCRSDWTKNLSALRKSQLPFSEYWIRNCLALREDHFYFFERTLFKNARSSAFPHRCMKNQSHWS